MRTITIPRGNAFNLRVPIYSMNGLPLAANKCEDLRCILRREFSKSDIEVEITTQDNYIVIRPTELLNIGSYSLIIVGSYGGAEFALPIKCVFAIAEYVNDCNYMQYYNGGQNAITTTNKIIIQETTTEEEDMAKVLTGSLELRFNSDTHSGEVIVKSDENLDDLECGKYECLGHLYLTIVEDGQAVTTIDALMPARLQVIEGKFSDSIGSEATNNGRIQILESDCTTITKMFAALFPLDMGQIMGGDSVLQMYQQLEQLPVYRIKMEGESRFSDWDWSVFKALRDMMSGYSVATIAADNPKVMAADTASSMLGGANFEQLKAIARKVLTAEQIERLKAQFLK